MTLDTACKLQIWYNVAADLQSPFLPKTVFEGEEAPPGGFEPKGSQTGIELEPTLTDHMVNAH